jgi:hypothetical protein
MIARIMFYNHARKVFHRIEVDAPDWRRGEFVAREAADFWRAPYFTMGRETLLNTTHHCMHDDELGRRLAA